jgi:hypothetical protein
MNQDARGERGGERERRKIELSRNMLSERAEGPTAYRHNYI